MTDMQVNFLDKLRTGFWSPVSASVDWCEPNYTHSSYIAETWNTFTNLIYIFVAIYALYMHSQRKQPTPFRFNLLCTCLMVVGFGSMLFHATLLRWGQLADELPMLYLISISFYCVVCVDPDCTEGTKWSTGLFASGVCSLVTYIMFLHPDKPVFFFVAFGVMTLATFTLTLKRAWNYKGLPKVWFQSSFFMVLGLGVWMFENGMCQKLEFLKFHSFWHLFSAMGAYRYGMVLEYIHYSLNGYQVAIKTTGFNFIAPKVIVYEK